MSKLPFSIEIGVGLATAPVLLALIAGKTVANIMQDLGEASEELFRGDRLPTLRMPMTQTQEHPVDLAD